MDVELRADAENPNFGFMVTDEQGRGVLAIASEVKQPQTGSYRAGEIVHVDVAFDCVLAAGEYQISPEVRHPGVERRLMDHRENAASFEVIGRAATGGMVDLPHSLSVSRAETVEKTGS